jgi:hypothetical protein
MQIKVLVFGGVVFALSAALAEAGWMTAVRRNFNRGYHRNQCWPLPFNCLDQQSVRAPFALQVANGWQLQTTIREDHYEPGSEKLNAAGRRHVHWILNEPPPSWRIIYVQRGESPRQTARRLDAVRQVARLAAEDPTQVHLVPVALEPAAADDSGGNHTP